METKLRPAAYSFPHLQQSAAKGMKGAMLLLAYCYQEGWSTKQDYRKAAHWYSKAIKAGEPLGIFFLGQLYQLGHGVKQDGKKAAMLFRKAYRLGVTAAAINLANIYDYGLNNIRPSRRLALYWYKIAAQQTGRGSNLAKERLAELMKSMPTE